jgi:hypothetical protein
VLWYTVTLSAPCPAYDVHPEMFQEHPQSGDTGVKRLPCAPTQPRGWKLASCRVFQRLCTGIRRGAKGPGVQRLSLQKNPPGSRAEGQPPKRHGRFGPLVVNLRAVGFSSCPEACNWQLFHTDYFIHALCTTKNTQSMKQATINDGFLRQCFHWGSCCWCWGCF